MLEEIIQRYKNGLATVINTTIEGLDKYKVAFEKGNIKYGVTTNESRPDLRCIFTVI